MVDVPICTRKRVPTLIALGGFFLLLATAAEAATRLYVANLNASVGSVQQYALPLTASSTPTLSIAINNVIGVALDSYGDLAVSQNTGTLSYFKAPLTAASTPSAVFSNGGSATFEVAFSRSGDLFATTQGAVVNRFVPPFSNSSVPAQTITGSWTSAMGAAFDHNGDLYVSNVPGNLYVVNPYGGAIVATPLVSGVAYRKVALSTTQAFVASILPGTGRVDVYSLPLTTASVPAFSITSGIDVPETVAVNPTGNLYVGNVSNSTVTVYAPPLSAASVPSVTLSVPGNLFGLAIENSTPRGDVNGDGQLTASDIFYLINYLFANGAPPI